VPDQVVFSIGAVARMLGVPAPTLRTWEERYGVVVPLRSPAGHRLYSRQQLEQLRFLRDGISSGLSSADAHRLLRERLDGGVGLVLNDHSSSAGNLLILLAEQDLFAADFAEYFLRTEGYDVALVVNEDEALAQMELKTPDVAVVDLLISSGRGLQLCAHLRRHFGIPILAISTLDLRDEALDAGASAFLLKPIDSLWLVATIQDLLGQSGLLRRNPEKP
jgi:DNA-binding transcriptional MerR regulator